MPASNTTRDVPPDSLAIYAVDPAAHTLQPVGYESTRGKRPRGFAFTPDERLLMVANQDSHNVVAFRVDGATGRLEATGEPVDVASPTCIAYLDV